MTEPSSLQVISGRLWIETENSQSFSVDGVEIATLRPGLQHYIFAEEEAIILLMLTGNQDGEF